MIEFNGFNLTNRLQECNSNTKKQPKGIKSFLFNLKNVGSSNLGKAHTSSHNGNKQLSQTVKYQDQPCRLQPDTSLEIKGFQVPPEMLDKLKIIMGGLPASSEMNDKLKIVMKGLSVSSEMNDKIKEATKDFQLNPEMARAKWIPAKDSIVEQVSQTKRRQAQLPRAKPALPPKPKLATRKIQINLEIAKINIEPVFYPTLHKTVESFN
ncbi:hypothetical protein JFY74_17585 [Pectobacterium carotovorum]|nr:hypothetical protein JFY74_17585 [Pectobacterium carotovorum]